MTTRILCLCHFALLLTIITLPAIAQGSNQAGIPSPHFGDGPVHVVVVNKLHTPELHTEIKDSGAVVSEIDYEAMVIYRVDENRLGGREALRALMWPVHDELDLVALSGYILDANRPAQTLLTLPIDETFGDPLATRLPADAGLYVVKMEGAPKDEWLTALQETGSRIIHYMAMNAYVVACSPENVILLEEYARLMPYITTALPLHQAWRMTPEIQAARRMLSGRILPITIQLIRRPGIRETLEEFRALAAGAAHHSLVGPYVNLHVDMDPIHFLAIASHSDVFNIERRHARVRNDEVQGQISAGNVSGNNPIGPGYLSWLASQGFGSGQFSSFSVNVVDDSDSLAGHPDLPSSRVAFQNDPTNQTGQQEGHGFLNAHIVGGFNNQTGSAYNDSAGYNYGLGIAPWARVGVTAIFGNGSASSSSWESTAYNQGARISTNSWGYNYAYTYDSYAQEYDYLVRDARSSQSGNQELSIIFAAGNDGSTSNTIGSPGTAKNVLTVGASENVRQTGNDGCGVGNSGANSINDIINFSSRGPVNSSAGDGRWKPELVAPGTHIEAGVPQSNYNGNSICNQYWPSGQTLYGWSSGTSHSTPGVAGGAALVRQHFLNNGITEPSPAMIKAVLVNSAEYMNGTGAGGSLPSNSQGMGRMNLGRAFDNVPRILVDQTQILGASGQSYSVNGTVADPSKPVRITLVWTDAPGSTSGAPYVNNLDLTVNLSGNLYRGNRFSGANSTTGGSADSKNNTESVFLPAGTSGSFTVDVTAASIGGNGVPGNSDNTDQDFALIIWNTTGGGSGGGPVALFTATPTSGIVPLTVNFTDSSSGSPTSHAWSFGDGATSTAASPTHTYTSAGVYTVALTVSNAAGSNTNTKTNHITVSGVPVPGINDGSFEGQTANSAPISPWTVDSGGSHIVEPSGSTSSDNGFPSDGSKWCNLSADGSDNATPPSNPGGVTTPPAGASSVSQSFTYPQTGTLLRFDAAFIRNETANQTTYNDWMSVELSDGSTSVNLYYADTSTATPNTSTVMSSRAMTALTQVTADISVLFPSSTTSTSFALTLSVGNGGDAIQASNGYVDNVRLEGGTTSAPVAAFSGTPVSGNIPLAVNFIDQSTGNITGRTWFFGDGTTSTAQNPSHTYSTAGTYTVILSLTGPGGSDTEVKTGYITATEAAPVANFIGSPTSGTVPLAVSFTNLTSGSVTSWAWNFGDGSTSTVQHPSHTYNTSGSYTVSLTATGPGGSDTETNISYIVVGAPAPVAAFSGTPLSGTVPLNVSFTSQSTGSINSYAWNFGDGSTSSAQNPTHIYGTAGTYSVSLTVNGPGGSDTHSQSGYITVSSVPSSNDVLYVSFSGTSSLPGIAGNTADDDIVQYDLVNGTWSTFIDGSDVGLSGTDINAFCVMPDGSVIFSVNSGNYTLSGLTGGPNGNAIKENDLIRFVPTSTGSNTTGSFEFYFDGSDVGLSSGSTDIDGVHVNSNGTICISIAGHASISGVNSITDEDVLLFTPTSIGSTTTGTWSLYFDGSDLGLGASSAGDIDALGFNSSNNLLFSTRGTLSAGGASGADEDIAEFSGSYGANTNGTVTIAHVLGSLGVASSADLDGLHRSGGGGTTPIAPTADFSATPLSGSSPLTVSFTDASSGSVTNYSWNFGDGSNSSAANPSHIYTAAGSYTVTLTVTGPGGSDTETRVDYINAQQSSGSNDLLYTSFKGTVSLPGISGNTADDDIVAYDVANGTWTTYFDGSDVGLSSTDINAFCVMTDGSIIFSVNSGNFSLSGLIGGPAGDAFTENDLIRFVPTSTGSTTSGTFEFYFDGSDVGLSTGSTDIDGVHVDIDGSINISIAGHASISGVNWIGDEDVLRFTPLSIGAATTGSWSLHFDGSDVDLNDSSAGDIDAVAFNAQGDLLFSTVGTLSSGSTTGSDEDVATFSGLFGTNTSGTVQITFALASLGVASSADLDGLSRAGGGSTGGGSNEILYTSFQSNTSIPGIGTAADDDILAYDTVTGIWSTYLDGSDVGLSGTDINAFCIMPDGSVIFSVNSATYSLPGLIGGPAGDSFTENDLIRFVPTSTGTATAGSFVFYMDGSDIDLASGSTDIDGVHVDASGLIYLSIAGHASLTGLGWIGDEDVLLFTPTAYGSNTTGSWSLHLDGSDLGLNASSSGDIDGFSITAADELLFTTVGALSTGGISGADEDIASFSGTFGPATSGTVTMAYVLSTFGIGNSADTDGLHR